jgi:energy-coupling factor transporter ATP-binding protein EcfA2
LASEPLYITPEYKDCLKALDYPGSGNRRAAIEKSHKSTLGWLDPDPSISGWFESEVNCVWILGKAGSGKSTLSKHILGRLNQTTQHMNKKPGEATLSFFFSDRGGDLDKSEAGCLRSLHQLLKQIPALSDYILPEYKLRKEQHAEVLWHTEDIKKMLISMIGSSYVSSIRIVIGALSLTEIIVSG